MQYHQFHLKKSKRELIITINESKFDASAVGEFRNRLSEAWEEVISGVTIDFSKVDFIDSSGIGALLSVQKRLKQRDEPVTILNAKPPVISVIELLRLHRVFTLRSQ